MVFSSTVFLFAFLPVTLAGYYILPRKLRNGFLLIMSLLFYAAGEPTFVFIMMASIAVNYGFGLLIWKTKSAAVWLRRVVLVAAVAANLGLLFYYKYYDFAVTNINGLFGTHIALRHIALPISISFFTFQGMSYVLDVYMGKTEVQKNPLHVALYIALFPQLIAGPIVRYSDVNEEIVSRHESLRDFASGVRRFSVGLAKKVILANNLALLSDQTFGMAPEKLGAGLAWLGAVGYTLQIYFDFSGYSDMAIGLGRMFGFHFLENFDHPYLATSVSKFWSKWHISLSRWFRDYVYIPMGGNRRGNVYVHLLIIFFLTGMWHGASWNYIVWGMWYGVFLIIERVLRNHGITVPVPKLVKWLYAMLVVVLGRVFFRADDLGAAIDYIKCMFGAAHIGGQEAVYALQDYGVTFILSLICMLPLIETFRRICSKHAKWMRFEKLIEPLAGACLLIIGIAFTVTSTYNPFIYFNF